jgi:hypothetical protein
MPAKVRRKYPAKPQGAADFNIVCERRVRLTWAAFWGETLSI